MAKPARVCSACPPADQIVHWCKGGSLTLVDSRLEALLQGILWSNRRCPFAHRARAVLHRLEVPHTVRETGLVRKDPAFRAVAPTTTVPVWVEQDRVLGESRVIAQYLAETQGWAEALPGSPHARAQQRLAMALWDGALLPVAYYRGVSWYPFAFWGSRARRKVSGALDALERAIEACPTDSVLGLMLGPFWMRFQDFGRGLRVIRSIRSRPAVAAWLDAAAAHPSVVATALDREAVRRSYRLQRAVGWISGAVVLASWGLTLFGLAS